ncbi:hypothetical protein RD792_017274 [Penstemon davidsonii]|uniref:MATH domain-containing protein n=1 Tax=Penstemon davidsonii TaxID=160366 RepID=A0ABR0CLM1_9LAMI|nr:hypothetical protein RD792_017274 [Penstemon davidsonii]
MAEVVFIQDPETVTIKGSQTFEIQGFSLTKGMGIGKCISSDTFLVGGHLWKIKFYPDGKKKYESGGDINVSLDFALVSKKCEEDIRVWLMFVLLDESGNKWQRFNGRFKMEPKALLHFIYCDVIPNLDSKCVDTIMTQHLLAAADRYGIQTLRSFCEARLCENIDINTVAASLALAEQHGCFLLKSTCLEFVGLPKIFEVILTLYPVSAWLKHLWTIGLFFVLVFYDIWLDERMRTVIQTDGFKNLKESCPTVIYDLLIYVARLRDYSSVSYEPGDAN